MRNLILALLLVVGITGLRAQSLTVTGRVMDNENLEVIGGNVSLKGAAGVGTITDMNGNYTITVNDAKKDVLVFSYIGMKTIEVPVKGRSKIDVTLEADNQLLEEVVVVGYATVKRKDLTGSVASIKSEDLMKVPTSDATQALAGRMAGVQIVQTDGQPGAEASIRVRGGISITQSNEPLYVIDGFPTEDGMSSLDPADIESIDVLKDASATAIYGARGANGVVLITTKSGKSMEGKGQVTFDAYVGFRKLANKLDVLSTEEFVLADYERTVGLTSTPEETMTAWQNRYGSFLELHENYGNRPGIDWLDETMGRTTLTQNYRVGVNGGSEAVKYNLAYSYNKDEGAMVYSGSERHNITLGVNGKVNDKLSVTARINFDYRSIYGAGVAGNGTNEGGSNTDARFNKMAQILQYRPTIGIKGSDDELLMGEDPLLTDEAGNVMQNPLINAAEEKDDREIRTLQANGGLTYKIMKGLTFRNNTGMRYRAQRRELFYGDQSIMGRRNGTYGSIRNTEDGSFQTSNVLTYETRFQKAHKLTAQLGQEYVHRWERYVHTEVSNLPTDDFQLDDMGIGTPSASDSYLNDDDNLLSFFARVNYDYKDKYLLSATLRADGSSKFSADNKWGIFPAVSAAWRLGEEEFIKKLNIFSDLKFRIGYGLAGNNRIGSYNSLALFSSVLTAMGDALVPGYASSVIPNKDLKWEANKTFNMGFDFGFLEQRITVSPEFYINRSSDLLLSTRLPMSSGYETMMVNAGETKNVGIDLTVNTQNIITKDFSWNTTLTFSHNKNTVEALTGEEVQLFEGKFGYNQNTHRLAVGEPIGQFYGFITDGLYQVDDFDYDPATKTYTLKDGVACYGNRNTVQPGDWKFRNMDGNDVIDENDKTVIGNASPKFYGGLNNNFAYKGFDLSIFFTFSYGNEVLNATKLVTSKVGRENYNALDVMNSHNRWMTINDRGERATDPAELAAMNQGKSVASWHDNQEGNKYIHSWAVEDASFLRLSNVTLGYTFPKQLIRKIKLSNLRVYATGNNLFTWTPYTGFDPEVSNMRSPLTPGVDFGSYPRSRSFIFGVNIAF
ncbi:SusC/RagA family TonB-linked outer membrane protein [Mediterranea massiliensis]|uniref:SusC/RagA family TonB-linked outer membrane protein n=1 Tax=Mediterranea massiliensis TaxID=1841865 RepID=UPI0025A31B0C|nr:TonB-dependent receptor [Mediterranea massiliensis]MDM8337894.1 TonB-dependent receptor [Mediterranea massiliensis]